MRTQAPSPQEGERSRATGGDLRGSVGIQGGDSLQFCQGVGRGDMAQKLPRKGGRLEEEWVGFCLMEEEGKVVPGVGSCMNKGLWRGLG